MSKHQPARDLVTAARAYCHEVEFALRGLTPDDFSIDLRVTIRKGRIRVRPEMEVPGDGWKDQSGG